MREIVWRNVLLMAALHLFALRGLLLYSKISFATFLFTIFLLKATALGVQLGAHRLWAHRSFQATAPLRLLLALCHVLALQNDLYEWCRDHRAHHAYSETDADPHDSRRGFFFSHMGWLLVRKHPEVTAKGKLISLADLTADPVVAFQRRWYRPLVLLLWFALPVAVPVWGWGEPIEHALLFCVFFRYAYSLHITWLTNSWCHLYGERPYNGNGQIGPAEAHLLVRHLVGGEAFHNYHHAFPWDAGASELGPEEVFNPASAYLNCLVWLGLASGLKRARVDLVERSKGKRRRRGKGRKLDTNSRDLYQRGHARFEWFTGYLVNLLPHFLFWCLAHFIDQMQIFLSS